MNLSRLTPFFDPSVSKWAIHARLLHWLTFLWLFVGLGVMFSASYTVSANDGFDYIKRQLIAIFLGLIIFTIIVNSPLRYILGISHWCVIGLLLLIFITLIPGLGDNVNGSARWLKIGSIPTIQPSEVIKPFLVLQSARLFGKWNRIGWGARITWLIIFALVLLGILKQPNLSTTALCGITIWLIALAAGLPYHYLGGTALGGIIIGGLSIALNPYQQQRVTFFINPWVDPTDKGYQLIQSLLAVASGGTWGVGFGLSEQKIYHLPFHGTDFIFAVFAEEFGFIGSLLLLLFLLTYATVALIVAVQTRNSIHRLVAIGVMVLLVGQSMLNIGVATGVLPTTGLPLPFISYGGNSMVASLLAAALIIRVARESSEADILPMQRQRAKY